MRLPAAVSVVYTVTHAAMLRRVRNCLPRISHPLFLFAIYVPSLS
jgi:hypothetical protein